jgi:hypothetical protein
MEADELAEFAAALAEAAGIGLRPVKARVAKAQRERKQAEQRAAVTSEGDGRMVRPRPESDGELTPTVTYLDLTLAADEREEPPMRDASGKLVEVRVREPWAMHLLTSDNVNAENAGDEEEAMKPPGEPGLERLSPVRVEMLVERYVVWIVTKKNRQYFAALPPPFVDGLMQFSPSSIPIVRAINTAPLVSMSGEVIAGAGLDRKTGLFHCIDALLQGCIPVTPPTEQDVRAALIFLYDDWLVDVALDPVGKAVAIMLAMTLIERTLLPERPAFFIAAALRGGGKTTLVNMITLAVLGRRASAAAWSYSAEERRKALFSYFRQAVACLVWDNIIRGSAISCPHIEKALTATEISDRVLGGSLFETVSSTTVQIFTGNSITPRGDMASRSMRLALTVDRPDPENRAFVHADPLAWTEANRGAERFGGLRNSNGRGPRRRPGRAGRQTSGSSDCSPHRQTLPKVSSGPTCVAQRRWRGCRAAELSGTPREYLYDRGRSCRPKYRLSSQSASATFPTFPTFPGAALGQRFIGERGERGESFRRDGR